MLEAQSPGNSHTLMSGSVEIEKVSNSRFQTKKNLIMTMPVEPQAQKQQMEETFNIYSTF